MRHNHIRRTHIHKTRDTDVYTREENTNAQAQEYKHMRHTQERTHRHMRHTQEHKHTST